MIVCFDGSGFFRFRISILKRAAGVFALSVAAIFAASSPAPPPLGRLIDAGGYRVHLYCTGTGSPTVMVVGAGFSFDWGLVQPEVAKSTRICTYDPAGTAWSDPHPSSVQKEKAVSICFDRVAEIHRVLKKGGIRGPYVLVGFSLGGLVSRLYAHEYPKDFAGMVLVDHAFIDVGSDVPSPMAVSSLPSSSVDSAPVLISSSPITLGLDDDQNFKRLPRLDRDLHAWATSIPESQLDAQAIDDCFANVESSTQHEQLPLQDTPLIVIRTSNNSASYERLQAKLLRLFRRSEQVITENSSHMIIIDDPEVIIRSITKVVRFVRTGK